MSEHMFYYTYGASRWLQAAEAVDGMARGRDLEAAGEDGGDLDEQDLLYVELLHEVTVAHARARLKAEATVLQKVPLAWLRFGPGRDRGTDAPGWTRAVGDAPVEVRSAAEVLLTQALTQLGLAPEALPLTPHPPLPCTGEGEI
ncbi:MAG TPA: hypothetical protein VFH48_24615, partial [Chloroflexota bacterium]|nr:hypothetical protein [Chloroflexota bacterium]